MKGYCFDAFKKIHSDQVISLLVWYDVIQTVSEKNWTMGFSFPVKNWSIIRGQVRNYFEGN